MTPERAAWLIAALGALAAGLLALRPHGERWLMATTGLAGLFVAGGLLWRSSATALWPGATLAERLALLAAGALAASAWQSRHALRHGGPKAGRGRAALLAAAAAAAGAAALADGPAAEAAGWTWLAGLAEVAAGIGAGGLLAAFALSAARRAASLDTEGEPPAGLSAARGAALDAGRGAALLCYPWLTAAALLTGAYNLAASAALWRGEPGELWLLAAWLLVGAYLHLTSSWRPLRAAGWLPTLLAALAFAAAFAAVVAGRI